MKERDAVPTGPRARHAVDQGHALGVEPSEVALEVLGAVRDVVQSLAMSREEAADSSVGTERFEQFHGADEGDADSLGSQALWRSAGIPGEELEEASAPFDGVYGHGDVVERPSGREGWDHRRMLGPAEDCDKENGDGDE